jgi:hypothetical protein
MEPPKPIFKRADGSAITRGTRVLNRRAQWSEWVLLVNPQITAVDATDERNIAALMDGAFESIFSDPAEIASFMHTLHTSNDMMTRPIVSVDNNGVPRVDALPEPSRRTRPSRRREGNERIQRVDWTGDRFDAEHVFAHTWFVKYEIGAKRRVHAMLTYRVLHDSAYRINIDPQDPASFPFVFAAAFNRVAEHYVLEGKLSAEEFDDRIQRPINATTPPLQPGVYVSVMSARALYKGVEYNFKDDRERRGTWTRRPAGYGDARFEDGAVRDTGQLTFPPIPTGDASRPEFVAVSQSSDAYAKERYVRPAARRR